MEKTAKALTWTELRVGVVALVSLGILAVTILYIGGGGGTPFTPRYDLKALMSDVNGLKPGAPVRVGGVEVGTVTRVGFASRDARGMVEVTMRLDRRVQAQVTTDSQAQLGSLGLLGEKAVDISSSTRGTPIEEKGYVPAASEDPFKGLLSDASESTAHMRRILSRLDAGEGLVGKALRDEELYTRMVDVSVRLQGVMGKLEAQQGPLGRLMNDQQLADRLASSIEGIESTVRRVDSGQGALGALTRDEELLGQMKSLVKRLDEVAGGLQQGEGSAGRMLKDDALYTRLTDVSGRLDGLLARIESGEGSAGRLMRDAELYENLTGALHDVRTLVADVRKDPSRYLRVKVSLF
jgi:phospholipid/cholesterol/gamma-HCH transport system substrate-binding protein